MSRLTNLIFPGRRLHLLKNLYPTLHLTNRASSSSSKLKTLPVPAVCLSKDGTTFLAYHPQRDFPYEHSQPLPAQTATGTPDEQDTSSPLKVQIMKGFKDKIESKKLTERDLAKMFGDYEAYFRPQPQERSRKEDTEYRKKLKQKTLNELPED